MGRGPLSTGVWARVLQAGLTEFQYRSYPDSATQLCRFVIQLNTSVRPFPTPIKKYPPTLPPRQNARQPGFWSKSSIRLRSRPIPTPPPN